MVGSEARDSNRVNYCASFNMSVSVRWCDFNLYEGESGSRGEGFGLVFDLVPQILLHSFLLEHLLLPLSPKQDPRGDGDGHCILWLWLQKEKNEIEDGMMRQRKTREMSEH